MEVHRHDTCGKRVACVDERGTVAQTIIESFGVEEEFIGGSGVVHFLDHSVVEVDVARAILVEAFGSGGVVVPDDGVGHGNDCSASQVKTAASRCVVVDYRGMNDGCVAVPSYQGASLIRLVLHHENIV